MMDILVTTPKSQMANAAKEAAQVIANKGGKYFRYLGNRFKPGHSSKGDRIFYVEDGYVRGFCIIDSIKWRYSKTCDTTGNNWEEGWYIEMDATSWQWIDPIVCTGFQGWRYMPTAYLSQVKIVGNYLDDKPKVN